MKTIVENFSPFEGQHCETTAIGNLLKHEGVSLSEPMLFGIGEGIGYIFWNMKMMDIPFIGGRTKPDLITQRVAKALNLELNTNETALVSKAWNVVKENIDQNIPVGLKLDCFHLEYFTKKFHFAGHYATIYGYDDEFAYVADTAQQGRQLKTSLKSLALARNEKGPMSSRNLSFTFKKDKELPDLGTVIRNAIRTNAREYLSPPIQNVSYLGIAKTSKEIFKWFNSSKNVENDFKTQALLMEKAGTGGALFRNIYRDFLKESYELLKLDALEEGYLHFKEIAQLWNRVSFLFDKVGATKNVDYLKEASEILKSISNKERETMEILAEI